MNNFEKMKFAIWLVQHLVCRDQKIMAVSAMNKLYECGLKNAKEIVEMICNCAGKRFLKEIIGEEKDRIYASTTDWSHDSMNNTVGVTAHCKCGHVFCDDVVHGKTENEIHNTNNNSNS